MNNIWKGIGTLLRKCARPRYLLGGAVMLGCLLLPFLLDFSTGSHIRTRTFPMMGTMGRLSIYSDREEEASEKALDEAQQTISAIEKVCNIFQPESELSRLNRTAYEQEFRCSPLLWEMIAAADHYYRFTDGAFDPTIRPLMTLWGFRRKRQTLPDEAEIAAAMKKVGWNRVKLDPEKHSVRFTVEGIGIDFGGIAKGFALEKAKEIFRRHGIKRAILDLGGNIGCLVPDQQHPFRIGVRDPEAEGELVESVELRDQCVATSGNYESYVIIDGKQYTHIMDPRTGRPVSGILSVTIVTPRGTDSDALSTAIFVRGESFAEEVCRKLPGTGVLLIRNTPEGRRILRFGSLIR